MDGSNDDGKEEPRREPEPRPQRPQRPNNDGPPDLDELWRDFNRRLSGLFGRVAAGGAAARAATAVVLAGSRPNGKGAGLGLAAVLAVIALIWLGSGFYIVPEGQVSVVTTFGKVFRRRHLRVFAGVCRGRCRATNWWTFLRCGALKLARAAVPSA